MAHPHAMLSGLVLTAAGALVVAAAIPLPSTATTSAGTGASLSGIRVAPSYPHNINPDPNGPYYINPYDPYAEGYPDDVTPPVIGLSPPPPDSEPIHAPKHR